MSFKTNQIDLNIPSKVLAVDVTTINGSEEWPFDDNSGDRWWEGGLSPRYYRWEIQLTVTAQNHGSHLTRDDFQFNGLDVVVGDWIAGATTGQCLKIISVSSKTANSVTCIVEDWLRYNTFKSANGNGIFNPGKAVVFTINENGLPMLDPLPTSIVSSDFYSNVNSRFQYLNPQLNYVLEKQNHGFQKGDVICMSNDGFYVKANSTVLTKQFGVVTHAGPGPNQFMIQPSNRIIDFNPAIPGSAGDFVYADTDGDLTTTNTGKIIFLKIRDAIPTVSTGSEVDPEVPANTSIILNGSSIVFSGSGNVNVESIANAINSETANTSVVATNPTTPTVVTSNASGTAYGLVGGFAPFSAYFNTGSGNTLVNFTSTAAGQAAYGQPVAIPEDMANDLDSANIANLSVSYTNDSWTLTEENGNAIVITAANSDVNANPFVGTGNVSGLVANTSASTSKNLVLTRTDGGEILIYESTPVFQNATGVFSAHTGSYPLALNVEQGIRSASVTVVADIAARNSLSPGMGDQAYVIDTGEGEWGLFLHDGTEWVEISNEDSATTDARTLSYNWTCPVGGGFAGVETVTLGRLSPGSKVTSVMVEVETALENYTTTPAFDVGTQNDIDLFMSQDVVDLESEGFYESNPGYQYPDDSTSELEIKARFTHKDAQTGNITVRVTYV